MSALCTTVCIALLRTVAWGRFWRSCWINWLLLNQKITNKLRWLAESHLWKCLHYKGVWNVTVEVPGPENFLPVFGCLLKIIRWVVRLTCVEAHYCGPWDTQRLRVPALLGGGRQGNRGEICHNWGKHRDSESRWKELAVNFWRNNTFLFIKVFSTSTHHSIITLEARIVCQAPDLGLERKYCAGQSHIWES